MRVAAFTGFTGPDDVTVLDREDPTPSAGEAVIDVEACSINRHDLWILEGDSAMVGTDELPFVSGLDVAGTVSAVGGDDAPVAAGDRVVLCPNQTCGVCRYCREGPENLCERYSLFHGGLAERALVDVDRLVPLPDAVDATIAAAIPTAYMTAYHMLRRAETAPGDLVFVPGATGGVGVAAVQLIDTLGARSVGTTTSSAKAARLRDLGAGHVIEAGDPEEIAMALGELSAPDAVLNHLGGEFTELGLDVLRRGGRMVICGRTAGDRSAFDVPQLFLSHQRIIGSTMGTQDDLERLVRLIAAGAFEPPVDATYPLEETGTAFADMQRRDAFGKLVIQP
ncbi:alcohol dehydrogenase catalytic domain-containing protein [Halomarina pelagica]|uniref:alcohol dehydrogenase catalytic domain-containing protein n=1 Tax=Halomarina pelagica TaxID=2961599 RepID=UPI0020C4C273|nr:zinc-binding dehydrogenase [Halomarina sp. BND7]